MGDMFNFGPGRKAAGQAGSNAAIVSGMPGSHGDAYFRQGQQGFDQQTGILQAQMRNEQMKAQSEGLLHLVKLFAELHKHAMKVKKQGESILPKDENGNPVGMPAAYTEAPGEEHMAQGSPVPHTAAFPHAAPGSLESRLEFLKGPNAAASKQPYYHKSSQELLDSLLNDGSGEQGFNMYNRGR